MSVDGKESIHQVYTRESVSDAERIERASSSCSKADEAILPEEDVAAERALVRRLDRRILPIACLMYLAACAFFPGLDEWIATASDTSARSGQEQPGECAHDAPAHH